MSRIGIAVELWTFLRERKKLIFLPLILMLILLTVLAMVVEIPVLTPFIYAIF